MPFKYCEKHDWWYLKNDDCVKCKDDRLIVATGGLYNVHEGPEDQFGEIVRWSDRNKYKDSTNRVKGKDGGLKMKIPLFKTNKERIEHRDEIYRRYYDESSKVIGKDGGLKNDKDKPDWSLIPLETIEGIVRVLTYGAKKYERDNWKKVSTNRNFAALLRHLTKWQAGEELDPESGLHHLDHAMCDLMFIKWRVEAKMGGRLPVEYKPIKEITKRRKSWGYL